MYVERRLYIPIGGLLLPRLPRLTASVQLLLLVVREASRPHEETRLLGVWLYPRHTRLWRG